jgi:hypothetical protein
MASRRLARSQPLAAGVSAGLVVLAVARELAKPRSERTWHGCVAGFVPYDFRPPTLDRLRERIWAPENKHLLTPQVFGLGWTVNLGRLARIARPRR